MRVAEKKQLETPEETEKVGDTHLILLAPHVFVGNGSKREDAQQKLIPTWSPTVVLELRCFA